MCNRYLAYILTKPICDDWQNRPGTSWAKKLELTRDDLKMIERHGIRNLQKGFLGKSADQWPPSTCARWSVPRPRTAASQPVVA